jgi:hypothetical protein
MPLLQVIAFFMLFVGGLLIYHTYLVLTNQTTYEASYRDRVPYLKDVPEHVRPFSRGVVRNLHSFCVCKRPLKFTLEDFQSTSDPGCSGSTSEEVPTTRRCWRNRR